MIDGGESEGEEQVKVEELPTTQLGEEEATELLELGEVNEEGVVDRSVAEGRADESARLDSEIEETRDCMVCLSVSEAAATWSSFSSFLPSEEEDESLSLSSLWHFSLSRVSSEQGMSEIEALLLRPL